MKLSITIVSLLFSLSLTAQNQEYLPASTYILSTLTNLKIRSYGISQGTKDSLTKNYRILNDVSINEILPYRNGLIFTENGTGRLFYSDSTGNITRLDNTTYGGDRFGAFVFIHNDTIYSIGGYGFWRVTGAVRYFNPITKEWNVTKTTQNIKVAAGVNAYFHHDEKHNKVYVLYYEYPEEYILNEKKESKAEKIFVQIFDLTKKDWSSNKFFLNPKLASDLSDIKILTADHKTVFIHSKYYSQTLGLDFDKNEFVEIEERFNTEWIELNRRFTEKINYATDSNLVIRDLLTPEKKTINTGGYKRKRINTIYTEPLFDKLNAAQISTIVLIISNLILLIALFYNKRKNKAIQYSENTYAFENNESLIRVKNFTDLLDETETKVISLLSKNYKDEKLTSIDEINKIIGIDKRPYKIKNNMRADVLKLINKKFMDFSSSPDELIIRERSYFDKRYFEYTLNDRYASKIGIAAVDA